MSSDRPPVRALGRSNCGGLPPNGVMIMMRVMAVGMMHRVMCNPAVMLAGVRVTLLSQRGAGNEDERHGQSNFLQHSNTPTTVNED